MLNSLSTPSDRPAFWALNDDLPSDAPIEVVEEVDKRIGLVGKKVNLRSELSEFQVLCCICKELVTSDRAREKQSRLAHNE